MKARRTDDFKKHYTAQNSLIVIKKVMELIEVLSAATEAQSGPTYVILVYTSFLLSRLKAKCGAERNV